MSAVRAMQEWCRLQCEGYPGVQIRDLSSSFRDGLAFCAMIHRHRPDLIDFDSLSKENVYENNHLAFEVAEQALGIPALLDPTDMVSMKVPDRLSIMTYVSQYYNYFRNPPPAGIPHPPAFKRSAASSPSEPALKKTAEKASTPQSEEEKLELGPRTSLSSMCATCHRHVHLVQRYLVEGRLYHRQCFRCKECCSTLLPGSYRPGPETGTFVCTHHRAQGGTISQSVPTSRRDDDAVRGMTASAEEQGATLLEEGRQKDSLAGGPLVAAMVGDVPGSSPVPAAASKVHGSPPRPTSASKSNGSEAPSLTVMELSSARPVEDLVPTALEMDRDAPADAIPMVTTSAPKEPTSSAKPRPQIQPKPTLPSKPASLQDQTSVASRSSDPVVPRSPINLQDPTSVTSRSSDLGVPRSPINLQDQTGAPSQSRDPGETHTPISVQDQLGTATRSADPMEPHISISPDDQAGSSSSGSSDPATSHISKSPEGPLTTVSSQSSDPQELHTPGTQPRAGARDRRPVPAARRPAGGTPSPQMLPVPRPRSIAPAESGSELGPFAANQVMNGGQPEPGPPVPKPRARPKSSERMENGKPQKEPPWITLVQMEKRRKAAPLPPGTPPRASAESQPSSPAEDREGRSGSRKPSTEPKPCNPFEDEDEEEEEDANESSLNPGHPWYGITPTSSPKARKRAAPKAPSASPLARHSSLLLASRTSHSEPSSSTPSPALSIESLSSEGGSRTPGDPTLSETVSKSTSEPAVCSPSVGELSPSNGGPAPAAVSADSSFSSANELANHEAAMVASPPSSRSSSCGSLRTSPHRPPPPKPPAPHVAAVPTVEDGESVPSPPPKTQPKSSCKENPFNRKASPVMSPATRKSTKGPKPARPPAPGHGFPLVKRKVQADQYIPEEDIHGELNAIERQLDTLELRGIELEGKLRSVDSETEEDDELLVDWFRLIHEKHILVRRESELVYVIKQQNLEQRQADVEYELRCLLNKPEKDWTEDDRAREQVLMQDMVTIIEQRNAIVTCLDEDRQREEEEDKLLAAMIKRKDFHRDAESASMKKKGKFKPLKALKMLSSKPDSKSKSPKDKS